MLTARLIMSASCIMLSPIVAPFDGTRRLNGTINGTNCAIAVTGASAGAGGAVACEFSPEWTPLIKHQAHALIVANCGLNSDSAENG
jgi:hypothetical protein